MSDANDRRGQCFEVTYHVASTIDEAGRVLTTVSGIFGDISDRRHDAVVFYSHAVA